MVIILYSVRRRRQYYFYNRTKNQSVVGIGEVSKHIHEKPPIPGRTNSTVIEVSYEKDITPITLSTLNKHPKLKNLYFLKKMQNRLLQVCHKHSMMQLLK